MTTPQQQGAAPPDTEDLVTLTFVIYGLHGFSALTGLLSPAFIVTAFLTGWPSIIAVIINYAKRADARGTWLESHFRWQIRTFWYALLWVVIALLLAITLIGISCRAVLSHGAPAFGSFTASRGAGRGWWTAGPCRWPLEGRGQAGRQSICVNSRCCNPLDLVRSPQRRLVQCYTSDLTIVLKRSRLGG